MPIRSTIAQGIQVGIESTEGTAVAANRRLSSVGFSFDPNIDFDQFRPMGNKFNTLSVPGEDWSGVSYEGQPTYDELVYLFSSLLTTATITTPATGTNSRQWEFIPAATTSDAPKSLTIERGDATIAERVAGALLTGMDLTFRRDSIDMSGDGMARAIATGITLTSSPTAIPLVPVIPKTVSVYVDAPSTSSAGATDTALGTTKLSLVREASLSISDRYAPFWALDAAQASYAASLEGEGGWEIGITPVADSTGMAFLTNARAGDSRAIRIEAVGSIIETTITYKLTIDAIGQIIEVGELSDDDGAQVIPYTFGIVYDTTWAKALRVRVVCTRTAL